MSDRDQPILQVRELTRRGREQRVLLKDIRFSIREGERIGLVGNSGSGKTCLFRAIVRLDSWDTGSVSSSGSLPDCQRDIVRFRRQVIYLPQRPAFLEGTVQQNLEFAFDLSSCDEKLDQSRLVAWLGKFGRGDDFLKQPVAQLSGGEQLIVALLRALSLSPRVLLLDEPTASLDATTMAIYEAVVQDWHQQDSRRAFVWTSHDRQQIDRMADRVILMRDGELSEAADA